MIKHVYDGIEEYRKLLKIQVELAQMLVEKYPRVDFKALPSELRKEILLIKIRIQTAEQILQLTPAEKERYRREVMEPIKT